MKVARFRFTIESVGDAIDSIQQENNRVNSELKDLITKQGQQLISLSKRVEKATTAANRLPTPRTPTTNRTLKRSRDSDHVPSKALVFGTNGVESAGISCIPPDEKLFWLYVSRFSNITTALQVEGLVKNVIGQDKYVQATALVKKGVDPLSLPFISFKVGVAFTDKEAITNPAIWPGNCGFREFEDVQRKLQSLQTGSGEQLAKKRQQTVGTIAALVLPSTSTTPSDSMPTPFETDAILTPHSENPDGIQEPMED